MGIHTWDKYFEYENKSLKSYIETVERYCSECHTNEDYGSCEKCPTGIFVGQLRKYLIELSDIMEKNKFREDKDEKTEIMIRIGKLLKKMPKLHPLYLPVDEDYEFNSVFNKLKGLSFELNLWEECFNKKFEWNMHLSEIRKLDEKSKEAKRRKNGKEKTSGV